MFQSMIKKPKKSIIFFQVIFSHGFTLVLDIKQQEIEETKGTFIIPKLKSSYWGPFSGLKTQDLIKTSRIFSGVIFCRRSFCEISTLLLTGTALDKSKVEILQNFVAFSEYMNFTKTQKYHACHRQVQKTNPSILFGLTVGNMIKIRKRFSIS